MEIQLDDVIAWLIIAALAGGLAGLLIKRKKEGFGRFQNLLIGIIGTVIGVGSLILLRQLNLLKADLIQGGVTVKWQDLAAACVGALLFLILLRLVRKKK